MRLPAELGSFHKQRWIAGQHLPEHQPIEQHAQARQMLFDRGRAQYALLGFDIGSDVQGPDLPQFLSRARRTTRRTDTRPAGRPGVCCGCESAPRKTRRTARGCAHRPLQ